MFFIYLHEAKDEKGAKKPQVQSFIPLHLQIIKSSGKAKLQRVQRMNWEH